MASYTLEQVFEGRRALITAPATATVGDALQLMFSNRVGQLPVVTADGRVQGIISQQSILGMYFHTEGRVDLMRLPVVHCQDPATTLTVQDDLLKAADLLRARGVYAVIATADDKPVGILTGKDMTYFFRSLFEGTMMVEQIEVTLRQCVDIAYPDDAARTRALLAAFGPSRQNKNVPARGENYLNFSDLLNLIRDDDNWPVFEPMLGPKTIFEPLLYRVRTVRDELSHFQGRPDPLEMDTLRRAVLWLTNRRLLSSASAKEAQSRLLPDVKLHPLSDVLAQHRRPLCVEAGATIGSALHLMTENRFGQLPVVDSAGELMGMISQQSLLSLYFFTGGAAPLLDLPLHHALEPAPLLTEQDDLFTAVDLLTGPGTGAAVVVRPSEQSSAANTPGQPVGIMTGKDMTHFFRTLFEGIILVERMEIALRDYTSRAFPDEESLNAAAMAVFGPGPNKPNLPARNPYRLTLGDRILLMAHDANWPRFESVLGPRSVFMPLAQLVRQVRNELMHFRGQLGTLEHDGLVRAYTWLTQRPPWPADAAPVPPSAPPAAQASGAQPVGEQAETSASAASS